MDLYITKMLKNIENSDKKGLICYTKIEYKGVVWEVKHRTLGALRERERERESNTFRWK